MDNWISLSFDIINELSTDEGRDMIFLCKDLVPIRTSNMQHLINDLKRHGYIDEKNMDLFAELLYTLKRYDLLKKHFKIGREEMEQRLRIQKLTKIPPLRLLLYELGELVPDSEFHKIKSVFSDVLPKAKLDKATSLLDAFIELEKKDVLQNLKYLKAKSEKFDDDFNKKLLEYEQNCTDEDKGEEIQSYEEDPSEEANWFYNMNSDERGICLIINNFNFEKSRQNPGCAKLKNRTGTEKDEKSLREVFSNLGFRIDVENDLDGDKILETVKSYSQKNYEKNDCFICCILSHGNTGLVFGADGQSVAIKDLTFCFCRRSCPSLDGKPKLFFIQACQGKHPQNCVPVESDACNASHDSKVTHGDLIPAEPDYLLGMATVMHCLAFRDTKEGSWYIQSLCEELHANFQRGEDILSILTKVNEKLSRKCEPNKTQMPQPWTTLSRKLVFNHQPVLCSISSQTTN